MGKGIGARNGGIRAAAEVNERDGGDSRTEGKENRRSEAPAASDIQDRHQEGEGNRVCNSD